MHAREYDEIDRYLTHAPEFFFELSLMFTVCNAEIEVRIFTLQHTVGRSCGANCQDSSRAFCPLCLVDLSNCCHILLQRI